MDEKNRNTYTMSRCFIRDGQKHHAAAMGSIRASRHWEREANAGAYGGSLTNAAREARAWADKLEDAARAAIRLATGAQP